MKKASKLAFVLALAFIPGIPMLSLPTAPAHASAAAPSSANYRTIKAALKKELSELNAQLNLASIKASLKQLRTHLDNARKVELDYRAAVDANKSEAERLVLANSWADSFQPAYQILSDLSINLGLEENQIEQKFAALNAVPARFARDKREIDKLMRPYQELKKLVGTAGKYVGPIQDALFSVTQKPGLSDAQVEALFADELVRILNARRFARE